MKKYRLFITFFVLSIFFVACSKSFLEIEPQQEVSISRAFEDVDALQNALTGVYSTLQSSDYYGRSMIVIPELMADNIYLSTKSSTTYTDFDRFIVTKFENYTLDIWTDIWETAYNASRAVQGGEALISGSAEVSDNLMQLTGEAYALKALAHFDLVRLFAQPYNYTADASHLGVPVIDQVENYPVSPARETVADVYSAIISNLEKAIDLMVDETNDGYFSIGAAEGLLSRVYLYKEEWDSVISVSTRVINSGNYSLIDNADFIASFDQDFNNETLFEVVNNETDNVGSNSIGYFFAKDGYTYGLCTTELKNLFGGTDIRSGFLKTGSNIPYEFSAIFVLKYPQGLVQTDNIRVMRLAEVYLNRAEAYAKKGMTPEALDDLNEVVERADPTATVSGLSGQDLIDRIILERRKELAFEGHRLFDLNRNKMDVNIISKYETIYVEYPNDKLILPIPDAEMNANENMIQNSGYDVN